MFSKRSEPAVAQFLLKNENDKFIAPLVSMDERALKTIHRALLRAASSEHAERQRLSQRLSGGYGQTTTRQSMQTEMQEHIEAAALLSELADGVKEMLNELGIKQQTFGAIK